MNMTMMIGTFTSPFRPLPRFGSRNAVWFLLLLGAIFTAVTPAMAQITPIFDPLRGPSSPDLVIDFSKYGYTPDGLARTSSLSGTGNGTDRPMNKTVATNFNTCNFTYELTVKTGTPNTDITFVGFGQGTPDAGLSNEPTEAFLFRIHNNLASNRIDAAVRTGGSFTSLVTIGTYNPGGTTFQIVCAGSSVTLSIVGQPGSATFALGAVPTLTASNSHLFFGNTAVGTTFSDFSVIQNAVPFAAFSATTELDPVAGEFEVKGGFTLGAGSDGINPPNEKVKLQLGTFSTTIPAGSFKQDKKGRFKFEGVIGGVDLEATIKPLGGSTFEFKVEGQGAADLPTTNPVPVTLTIGDDSGTATVTAEFEGGGDD